MKKKDILGVLDFTSEEIQKVMSIAIADKKNKNKTEVLQGKTVALLFDKPSLRTRVSFELAVQQLGGYSFYMGKDEVGLGKREPVKDVAKVLSRWVDCIIARVFSHETLLELAEYSTVPIINALSDWEHPCQAFADVLTIREKKGELSDLKIAYIGDFNNVARSLIKACLSLNYQISVASPLGYGIDKETLENIAHLNGTLIQTEDPLVAVENADIVYTDVWISMGEEKLKQSKMKDFQGFTIDESILERAKQDVNIMHPMPVHYGEEISASIQGFKGWSLIDQADNRLYAQKGVLNLIS